MRNLSFAGFACLTFLAGACGTPESNNEGNNTTQVSTNNGTTSSNNGTTAATNGTAGTNNTTSTTGNNMTMPPVPLDDVTYHNAVRAILESNCVECHYEGGIGPFPLGTFDEVSPLAQLIAGAVESGKMPPWPPASDCGGPIKHARELTDLEIATLRAWADNGAPEGDSSDYVAPSDNDRIELGEPDLSVDIGVDYRPNPPGGGIDDYHCFAIDPGVTQTRYLNGYQARPSNLQVAHHMLFWAVPASSANEIAQLSAQDPGTPGWTCFGGNGLGNPLDNNNLLGAWVPGAQPTKFEPGVGYEIPAGSIIIVQMHYNTLNDTEGTDRTTIDLHWTDGPADTVLQNFLMGDFSLNIAPGDPAAQEGTSMTLGTYPPIYGIFPHMHTLGTKIKITAEDQCVMDIPKWDFNWQGYYYFEEPLQLDAGTTLSLDCEYDNSQGTDTVRFGEGTLDEMCLAFFVIPKL